MPKVKRSHLKVHRKTAHVAPVDIEQAHQPIVAESVASGDETEIYCSDTETQSQTEPTKKSVRARRGWSPVNSMVFTQYNIHAFRMYRWGAQIF